MFAIWSMLLLHVVPPPAPTLELFLLCFLMLMIMAARYSSNNSDEISYLFTHVITANDHCKKHESVRTNVILADYIIKDKQDPQEY